MNAVQGGVCPFN